MVSHDKDGFLHIDGFCSGVQEGLEPGDASENLVPSFGDKKKKKEKKMWWDDQEKIRTEKQS